MDILHKKCTYDREYIIDIISYHNIYNLISIADEYHDAETLNCIEMYCQQLLYSQCLTVRQIR